MRKETTNYLTRDYISSLYKWFAVIRITSACLMAVLIIGLWLFEIINFDPRPLLYALIPFEIMVSFIWLFVDRKNFFSWPFLNIQIAIDILVITLGVYLSGGIHSSFAFVYLISIISAALVSLLTVMWSSGLTIFLYLILVFAENSNLITPIGGTHIGFHDDEIIRISTFVVLAIIAAFQSNFFVSQIRKKNTEVLALKDEFLFKTVHDLRSPSNVIRLIVDKYEDPNWLREHPETVEDVSMVKEASSRILDLIKDLLEIAKSGKTEVVLNKSPADLTDIIRYAVRETGPVAKAKNITVEYTPDPKVPAMLLGDADGLKEVFVNLIDNGIKYNKEGGVLSISLALSGKFLKIEIKDTGIGISPENLKKLFTPFFRGDIGRETVGSGLGLYIVKNLVEKMGGKIEVTSKLGEGTTFSVLLPIVE